MKMFKHTCLSSILSKLKFLLLLAYPPKCNAFNNFVATNVTSENTVEYVAYDCKKKCRNGYCKPVTVIDLDNDGSQHDDFVCECEKNWAGPDCNACDGRRLVRGQSGVIMHGDRTLNEYRDESSCSWLVHPDYFDHLDDDGFMEDADGFGSLYKNANVTNGDESWEKFNSTFVQPIHLIIKFFSSECNWDHLYIYDGQSAQDEKLLTLTGDVQRENLQVVARSGMVYIAFTADGAVNSTGFRIKWQLGKCLYSCAGHGNCVNGYCDCENDYYGDYCQYKKCPDDCNGGVCQPETGICLCQERPRPHYFLNKIGDNCAMQNGWQVIQRSKLQMMNLHDDGSVITTAGNDVTTVSIEEVPETVARTGHAMTYLQETNQNYLIIIGGLDKNGNLNQLPMLFYDIHANRFNIRFWTNIGARYGHSAVIAEMGRNSNKLVMFGGRLTETEEITNELWEYDINISQRWTKIETDLPALVDHRSVFARFNNGTKMMLTFFGYSPLYSYTNWVLEYFPEEDKQLEGPKPYGDKRWRRVKTNGYSPTGAASHSAVFHYDHQSVYIYGGYRRNASPFKSNVSPLLLKYLIAERKFVKLTPSSSYFGRYKHSASLIGAEMYIMGGSTVGGDQESSGRSETEDSKKPQCITEQLLVYNINCDSWTEIISHTSSRRIGHTSVALLAKKPSQEHPYPRIITFGGFNGTILNAMNFFSPGKVLSEKACDGVARKEDNRWACEGEAECSNCLSATSSKCFFCGLTADSGSAGSGAPNTCGNNQIGEFSDVLGEPITENYFRSSQGGTHTCPKQVTFLRNDQCRDDAYEKALCSTSATCSNCLQHSECVWVSNANRELCIRKPMNASSEWPSAEIKYPNDIDTCPSNDQCSKYSDCETCVKKRCIFCQQRCVNREGVLTEYPYGLCPKWISMSKFRSRVNECERPNTFEETENDACIKYKSCDDCHKQANCGWCDYGKQTGEGRCYTGGQSGPENEAKCKAGHDNLSTKLKWYFIGCPQCQCNGHSTCTFSEKEIDNKTIAEQTCDACTKPAGGPVKGLYKGRNCQWCNNGYFGDPRNAGVCEPCSCDGRAEMCRETDGACYCKTMWAHGKKCESCQTDNQGQTYNRFWSNVTGDFACFIKLTINFQYTFQLKGLKDKYIRQLNAIATPILDKSVEDKDITITVETSSPVRVVFTLVDNVKKEKHKEQDDKTTCLKKGVCEKVVHDAMTQEVRIVRLDKDGKIIMVPENDIEDPEEYEEPEDDVSVDDDAENENKSTTENNSTDPAADELAIDPTVTVSGTETMAITDESEESTVETADIEPIKEEEDEVLEIVEDSNGDMIVRRRKRQSGEKATTTTTVTPITTVSTTSKPSTTNPKISSVSTTKNSNQETPTTTSNSTSTSTSQTTSMSPDLSLLLDKSETHTELRYKLEFTIRADAYQRDTSGNASIRIYITDFKAPIQIKVGVSQMTEWDLVTFFTVFFACFLSLLVAAFIAWRIKAVYDGYHTRLAQELEMIRMAARPFSAITIRCDQDARCPFEQKTELPPTVIAKQPFEGEEMALMSFIVWLPGEQINLTYIPDEDNKNKLYDNPYDNEPRKIVVTPNNQAAIGLGSSFIKIAHDDTEFGPNAAPFESLAAKRKREAREKKKTAKLTKERLNNVDPGQSRSTTKRIETWIDNMPAIPDKDPDVEAGPSGAVGAVAVPKPSEPLKKAAGMRASSMGRTLDNQSMDGMVELGEEAGGEGKVGFDPLGGPPQLVRSFHRDHREGPVPIRGAIQPEDLM